MEGIYDLNNEVTIVVLASVKIYVSILTVIHMIVCITYPILQGPAK